MQKWEYFVLRLKRHPDGEINLTNDYGCGGWELISVTENSFERTLYFKRPVS